MKTVGRWTIYALLLLILVIRLFTETWGVLPRMFNAVDFLLFPLLIIWAFVYRLASTGSIATMRLEWFLLIFGLTWIASSLLNLPQLLPAASLLYVAGYLTPILFALAIYNLNLGAPLVRGVERIFWGTALLGLGLGLSQVRELADNSDALVFTFGTNANQTAFFLALILSLIFSKWIHGTASLAQKMLALGLTPFFFLAGFKAMWVLYPLAVGITLFSQGLHRMKDVLRTIRLATGALALVAFITLFVPLPESDYFDLFTYFEPSKLGKAQVTMALPTVWSSHPWGAIVGVGPGTFTSRAFRTFAALPYRGGADDVTYSVIPPTYMTPLAEQIVIPLLLKPDIQLGSGTVDWPFTSYISLLAETGVVGFTALMSIYAYTWWRLMRSARGAQWPETRAVALAAAMTLGTLLLISAIDNYLEHTRLAGLTWTLVALAWGMEREERHALTSLPDQQVLANNSEAPA